MMKIMLDLIEEVRTLKKQNSDTMLNQELQNIKLEEQLADIKKALDIK